MDGLSHLDGDGRAAMVDVGAKAVTQRRALAEAVIEVPAAVAALLDGGELRAAKGPVLQTAVLAGTLAVKRTWELIPLCHPLPIDSIRFETELEPRPDGGLGVRLRCEVAVEAKTGVEMEALCGASVAALTVYDMCKAVTHEMAIGPVRLLEKEGGRRSVGAEPRP